MYFVRAIALEELKNDVAQRDRDRMFGIRSRSNMTGVESDCRVLPQSVLHGHAYAKRYPSPTSNTRTSTTNNKNTGIYPNDQTYHITCYGQPTK